MFFNVVIVTTGVLFNVVIVTTIVYILLLPSLSSPQYIINKRQPIFYNSKYKILLTYIDKILLVYFLFHQRVVLEHQLYQYVELLLIN